jgi:hypothetical protein
MRVAILLVIVVIAVVVGLALLPLPNTRPVAASVNTADASSDPAEIQFMQGGTVALDLEAGNYDIVPSSDDKITVNYDVNGEKNSRLVRISSGVSGSDARIEVRSSSSNFHCEIAVPEKSNLFVRLSAGNLKVDGIEGSKDIEGQAGNLTIDVGDTAKYGPVYASVTSGNLQANPWSVQKSGLARSFSAKGSGPYGLHAHVSAGNLVLVSKGK